MSRFRRNPLTGDLDHFYAVAALSARLRKALGDWPKNDAFNGEPLRVLRDALILTLGPKTLAHLLTSLQPQQKEIDEPQPEDGAGRE